MASAFEKRQVQDGLWEVYDEDSDQVVSIDGLPLTAMDEGEADEAIRRLQSGEVAPDFSPEAPSG